LSTKNYPWLAQLLACPRRQIEQCKTRCGALDRGVFLSDVRAQNECRGDRRPDLSPVGLLGVSGISADMRTLRASSEPAAREAIDLFVQRIVREIGSCRS
jgi:acetate kinase